MSTIAFDLVYADIRDWAGTHQIETQDRPLPKEKAGEFDGRSAVMNSQYGVEERTYYLIHALGSIVIWSLREASVQAMFLELREAKQTRASDLDWLQRAIDAYRAFETEASELGAWLIAQRGWRDALDGYTIFMRADLEAMTIFHQTGRAPVWRQFFARWKEDIRTDQGQLGRLRGKPIPPFRPKIIPKQEILQRQEEAQ